MHAPCKGLFMLFKLFLCFTLIPAIELYLLIQLGSVIGGLQTVALVITTGFFGAWLAKTEGINTMLKIRASMQQGNVPAEELIDALIIFIAGIVLITPGLLTDCAGLLLLWPQSRKAFKRFLRNKFDEMTSSGSINITNF